MNSNLPMDLQYLYKNDYFDSVKILMVLAFFTRRRKGLLIDEANYIFTLIDTIEVDSSAIKINKRYVQDVLLNNEIILKKLILRLVDSGYVDLKTEKMLNRTNIYLKTTESGIDVVKDMEHPLFEDVRKRIELINLNYKYSAGNYKEVLTKNE